MKSRPEPRKGFSILIPSWNNLEFLELLIKSLKAHSHFPHQIIVHVNEGTDGTRDFLERTGITYSYSEANVGVCKALNAAASLADREYLVFMNDDMYVLPGWDIPWVESIESRNDDLFFFSATLLEPRATGNRAVVAPVNFGRHPQSFREAELLSAFSNYRRHDWLGATWPPNIVSKRLWELVQGYSEEYSPGLYSDPDFSMKLWEQGVRDFRGFGQAMVYHFMSSSVQRVAMNPGKKTFACKWGLMPGFVRQHMFQTGRRYTGPLKDRRWYGHPKGWISKFRALILRLRYGKKGPLFSFGECVK
jgi:glycosyltransferase involved in cell wall biosynthesis